MHVLKTKFVYVLQTMFLLYTIPNSAQTAECLDFGSTSDYVALGNFSSINDWTIEMWFKPDGEV